MPSLKISRFLNLDPLYTHLYFKLVQVICVCARRLIYNTTILTLCRKGCIEDSGQPPPLKDHKCPFRKASQAQPMHVTDDSARLSKRQVCLFVTFFSITIDFAWCNTQSYAGSRPGDLTWHGRSPVDTDIISIPSPVVSDVDVL
jgi:hypothetical protein